MSTPLGPAPGGTAPGGKPTGTGVHPRQAATGGSDPAIQQAKTKLASISHDLDAIDKESKVGGFVDNDMADEAARRRGYKNYADARAQFDAARKAATGGGGATPPPEVGGDTGFGTAGGADQIRKYLPKQ